MRKMANKIKLFCFKTMDLLLYILIYSTWPTYETAKAKCLVYIYFCYNSSML